MNFWHFLASVVMFAFASYLSWHVTIAIIRGVQTFRWPSVTGRISRSRVTSESSRRGQQMYQLRITAEYTVKGRHYHTHLVWLKGYDAVAPLCYAKWILRPFPEGERVTVYYDPNDPSIGVLKRGGPIFAAIIVPIFAYGCAFVGVMAMLKSLGFLE